MFPMRDFFVCALLVATAAADHSKRHRHHPIDLTFAFDENTQYWDGNHSFNLTDIASRETIEKHGFYASNAINAPEHGGTHMDAPFHFNDKGWKIGDIPMCHLIAPGILVDVENETMEDGDFELQPRHLDEWVEKNGNLTENVIMLVKFGWAGRYGNRTAYFGNSRPPYKFPGISEDAARWIIASGKILGVGVDTPSLDSGKSSSFRAHRILASNNIVGMENVALLHDNLPPRNFDVIALPFKIKNGSGAPVRIVAM